MQDVFGETGKGTVVVYSQDTGLDASQIINVTGLDTEGMYIVDFSDTNAERFAIMPCFGKRNYVFAYGSDLGTSRSTITVLIFLSTVECTPGDNTAALKKISDWYEETRVSKGKKVQVTVGNNGKISTGFLIAMQIRGYNADLNAISVTFTVMTSLD